MTQEKKHSQLPWHVVCGRGAAKKFEIGDPECVFSADYKVVVPSKFYGFSSPEDLRFICKAANNFYPLLDACKVGAEILHLEGAHSTAEELEKAIKAAEEGNE